MSESPEERVTVGGVSSFCDAPPPTQESVRWVNKILAQIWPFLSQCLNQILKDSVEPEIQRSLPSALSGLHFTAFSLGSSSPEVRNVRVTGTKDSAELQMDVIIRAHPDISLKVGPASFGVKKLVFEGRLGLLLKPFLDAIPLVGAAQVYFFDPPIIDMQFSGLAKVADWKVISKVIKTAVHNVLCNTVVLPKHVVVRLDSSIPLSTIYDPPSAWVLLTVVEARDLKASDPGLLKKTSDPYCVIEVGSQKWRTETKKKTLCPKWETNNSHAFLVQEFGQSLTLEVYDDDFVGDDFIGRTTVDFDRLLTAGDMWLPVMINDTQYGEVRLTANWSSLSPIHPVTLKEGGLLCLLVDKGVNLPAQILSEDESHIHAGGWFLNITARIRNDKDNKIEEIKQVGGMVTDTATNRNPVFTQWFQFPIPPNHSAVSLKLDLRYSYEHKINLALCKQELEFDCSQLCASPTTFVEDIFHGKQLGNAEDSYICASLGLYEFKKETDYPPEDLITSGSQSNVEIGTESSEWLNLFMKQLWTPLGKAVKKILKEEVEPQVIASLPAALKNFKFTEIDLGQKPPMVDQIRVEAQEGESHACEFQCDLTFKTDCKVLVTLLDMASFGIKGVEFASRFGVVFKPLIGEQPVVGGVHLFFVNMPTVHLKFDGLASIANSNMIANQIKGCVEQQLGTMLVLPNRFVVKTTDKVDGLFLHPFPEGMARITIVKANNLKGADTHLLSKSTSDPYCIVKVGAKEMKTQAIEKNCNPEWNAVCDFVVADKRQDCQIIIFDRDTLTEDDFLGKSVVRILDMQRTDEEISWPVIDGTGTITTKTEWFGVVASCPPNQFNNFEHYMVFFVVECAKDLPYDANKKFYYCDIKLAAERRFSRVVTDLAGTDPRWDQAFCLPVKDALANNSFATESIQLDLVKCANQARGSPEVLCTFTYKLSDLVTAPNKAVPDVFRGTKVKDEQGYLRAMLRLWPLKKGAISEL